MHLVRRLSQFTLSAVVAASACTAFGDTLANFAFETNIPTASTGADSGPFTADAGAGSASGHHAGAATAWSSPAGNGSAHSYSSNTWAIGDYYQFATSATGYTAITIQWDQNRSSTGPATFDLQVSTDNVNYTTISAGYTVLTVTWSSGTPQPTSSFAPVSAGVAADNAATLYFRFVAASAPTSSGGTNRIDNVVISGTPVPEPASLALLAIGGLLAIRRR